MSHNLEQINDREISALTIRPLKNSSHTPTELRITKLGGVGGGYHKGLKIKVRRVEGGTPGPVEIQGEDLYALREFLAELPEEAFVRPAEPVEKPERWTDGDIVEEWLGQRMTRIWSRKDGIWHGAGILSNIGDHMVSDAVERKNSRYQWNARAVRQASGQDL